MTGSVGSSARVMWAQALALGLSTALAPALTVLCLVLLLPGIAAWCLDSVHGRPMGRAVLAFGIAGALTPIWSQIRHDPTMQGMLANGVDAHALGIAWGMAGAGWLIGQAAQFAVMLHQRSEASTRIRQLQTYRSALETDWDLGPH